MYPSLPICPSAFGFMLSTLNSRLLTLSSFSWRGQQSRAGAQDSAIGPFAVAARAHRWRRSRRRILRPSGRGESRAFTEENFAHSRLSVKPARENAHVVFQFAEA